MAAPYFSIVIPTRNRPQFILDTVISAAEQHFESFEVIVSDNSTDEATQACLRESKLAGKITYVRPPQQASMPDHWEFATLQANGRYVLVLTDRSVLRQGALEIVGQAIDRYGQDRIDLCAWRWSLFDDGLGITLSDATLDPKPASRMFSSKDVAAAFVGPQNAYPYTLPRGLNSCYGAALAARIRARHSRMFSPISPDFASAFLLLAHAGELLYIDTPLFFSRGLSSSTGGNASLSDATRYMETLGLEQWYRYVPIKAALVENLIYEDFLAMRDKAGGGLQVELNWVEYFVRCYKELLGKRGRKIMPDDQIALLFREWDRALKSMNATIQEQVALETQSLLGLKLRAAVRELPFGHRLASVFRNLILRLSALTRARTTVLNAAGFERLRNSDVGPAGI